MARAGVRLAPSLGVLSLLLLAPAASGLPRRQPSMPAPSGPDAYILSQGGNFLSTNVSLDALGAVTDSVTGDFLWIRRGGKVYVVRDDRTLDEARALFAPLRQLNPEQEALARQQSRLEADQEALDLEQDKIEQELDRISDDAEDGERSTSAQRRDLERKQRDLERKQRDLEPRAGDLEAKERELEAVEKSIEERENALEKKIEAKLWRLIDDSISRGAARELVSGRYEQ